MSRSARSGLDAPASRTFDKSADEVRGVLPAVSPFLFLALECARPLAGGARFDLSAIDEVTIGRGTQREVEVLRVDGLRRLALKLPDRLVSGRHARLFRAGKTWRFEDLGSRNGSLVEGAAVREGELPDRAMLEVGATLFSFHAALPIPAADFGDLESNATRLALGRETLLPGHQAALANLDQVARSTLPVLVFGESGTGKELLARAVHEESRRPGAFVALNCGALSPSLVEGQLFGHAKGAFSGAIRDEPGLVRASHQGTLFLDEIAELPLPAQATLLRVLQEHEVLPVGATKPVSVDLRVVAATHQRIDLLPAGMFRSDLYARLAGFTVRLPPLRARREDLGIFVAAILRELCADRRESIMLTAGAGRALLGYAWPLNVRELKQALSVALLLAKDGVIDAHHLPEPLRQSGPAPSGVSGEVVAVRPPGLPAQPLRSAGSEAQLRHALVEALTQSHGNVSEVARTMGRTRMQIHRWMKRFALDPEAFR